MHRNENRCMKTILRVLAIVVVLTAVGSVFSTHTAWAACPALASDKGQVANTFSVSATGTYTLWLRLNAPDANRDSVYVQVDDQCLATAGSATNGGYVWVNYQDGDKTKPLNFSLAPGQHTLRIAGREAGAGVDKAMLLDDGCVPVGTGANCPAAASAVTYNAPGGVTHTVTKALALGHRNWWLTGACAGIFVLACGLLVWKYLSFRKVLRPTGDHATIVVGAGLPTYSGHRETLKGFVRHHRLLAIVCGSAIVVSAIIGTAAAEASLPTMEIEAGTLSGAASVASDTAASGGKFVIFGTGAAAASGSHGSGASGGSNTQSGGGGSSSGGGGGNSTSLNLPRVPWEGGPSYYAQFPQAVAAGWTNPNFFPISAWYMRANSQSDINTYKSLHFNTVTSVENNNSLPLFRSNGISVINDDTSGMGAETVSYFLGDEDDMTGGPGAGNTSMQNSLNSFANDGRPHSANYGKGVMFWESDTDAASFVNGYTQQVSDDIYWYTDSDVCTAAQGPYLIPGSGPISIYTGLHDLTQSECRRAANYGVTMDRMRALDALDGKRQSIWNFVEIGTPFNSGATITADQMAGAVWASLIHEARGILYFKHNFGGPCQTNDSIIDGCYPATTARLGVVNGQIQDLAPVLNTQSYQWTFNSSLDTMLKAYNGSYYVMAIQGPAPAQITAAPRTLTLPPGLTGSTVQVLYENRTIPITGNTFADSFAAESTYHIYKITP